jgi:hypothetical protein
MDAIILNKKVWYLDPIAICEARHAEPKWMKDDNDYLKPFATKKEKQKEQHKFHQETVKRVVAYISHMMTRWEDMDVIFAPYHIQ